MEEAQTQTRPEGVEDWFQVLPNLWASEDWEVALARPLARLTHCRCPWGGHLIRFEIKDVIIENPPEKTGQIIVRPEVRAAYHDRIPLTGTKMICESFFQPGEATLKGQTSTKLMRLCAVLFGDLGGSSVTHFFHDCHSLTSIHQKIRRDYPLEGDCALAFWQEKKPHEGIFMIRPTDKALAKTFDVFAVLRLPEDKFASWATFQFRTLLAIAHKTVQWMLNRPGIEKLRALDQNFYVILQMQSFGRGFPLIPADQSDSIVTIDAGEELGYPHWKRFESDRFRMPQYMKCFCAALGLSLDAFEYLDSRKLVPYQCVLRRSDWEALKPSFLEVFRLAKTAYRRANSGTVAPGIQAGVEARYIPDADMEPRETDPWNQHATPLVVRKTFLDLEEPGHRPARRPRTTKF